MKLIKICALFLFCFTLKAENTSPFARKKLPYYQHLIKSYQKFQNNRTHLTMFGASLFIGKKNQQASHANEYIQDIDDSLLATQFFKAFHNIDKQKSKIGGFQISIPNGDQYSILVTKNMSRNYLDSNLEFSFSLNGTRQYLSFTITPQNNNQHYFEQAIKTTRNILVQRTQ